MFRYIVVIMTVSSIIIAEQSYKGLTEDQLVKLLQERDELLQERDELLQERDELLQERDEKDELLQEKDGTIKKQNDYIKISNAELERMAILENDKNPDVQAYIPEERLRKAVAKEKTMLYSYTDEDFRAGNQ